MGNPIPVLDFNYKDNGENRAYKFESRKKLQIKQVVARRLVTSGLSAPSDLSVESFPRHWGRPSGFRELH
jgi:hypothetical protein